MKTSKQIFVTCGARTVAILRDSPENRQLAKRLAVTVKRKHPREVIKVSAG